MPKVILYPEKLDSGYVPEHLLYRDDIFDQLTSAYRPFLDSLESRNIIPVNARPMNAFLYGSPGIGKSAIMSIFGKMIASIAEKERNVIVRIKRANCVLSYTDGRKSPIYKVVRQLVDEEFSRGLGPTESLQELQGMLLGAKEYYLAEIDNVEYLKPSDIEFLSRMKESVGFDRGGFRISFLFAGTKDFGKELERFVIKIPVPDYTEEQMKNILKKRAEEAFSYNNFRKVPDNTFELITMASEGNVGIGLGYVYRLGRAIEQDKYELLVKELEEEIEKIVERTKEIKIEEMRKRRRKKIEQQV